MNKNKGFTLIEVLLAITLLSFVIMMSNAFFSGVLKQNKTNRKVITNNSDISSFMEERIVSLRKISSYHMASDSEKKKLGKPEKYDEAKEPLEIKEKFEFKGNNIRESVKGYFVSVNSSYNDAEEEYENLTYRYNNLSKDDDYVTFVAYGKYETSLSSIKDLSLEGVKNFMYHPLDVDEIDVKVKYEVVDAKKKNDKVFHAARITPYISKSSSEDMIYRPISSVRDFSTIIFSPAKEAIDSKEKEKETISVLKLKNYQENKKEYLKYVDSTIAADAFTLNKNGKVSLTTKNTFENDKLEKKFLHLISLPYKENLSAFYDYNLCIAKSNDNKEYISLFDENKKDSTSYGGLFYKDNDVYKFVFNKNGKIDVRKLLNLDGNVSNEIELKQSFVINKKESDSSSEYPYVVKSYGNTMYFEKQIATLKPSGKRTLFLKFNNENYNNEKENKNEAKPFVLLSNNIDLEKGEFQNKAIGNGGFLVYVDKDNKLKYINWGYEEKTINKMKVILPKILKNEELINLDDTNLYTSSNRGYEFSSLAYDKSTKNLTKKRDGREKFNIVAISLDKNCSDLKISVLKRKKDEKNLQTENMALNNFKLENLNYDNKIILGGVLEKDFYIENNPKINNQGNSCNIEVSDILMYDEDLSVKKQGTSSKMNLILDYLYRKYLTESERRDFDEYFVNKY